MSSFFISYHFSAAGGVTGFGDYNITGSGIYDMDDVVTIKGFIKALLLKQDLVDPTVVILGWQQFNQKEES
jgi:hypothetical protein